MSHLDSLLSSHHYLRVTRFGSRLHAALIQSSDLFRPHVVGSLLRSENFSQVTSEITSLWAILQFQYPSALYPSFTHSVS